MRKFAALGFLAAGALAVAAPAGAAANRHAHPTRPGGDGHSEAWRA